MKLSLLLAVTFTSKPVAAIRPRWRIARPLMQIAYSPPVAPAGAGAVDCANTGTRPHVFPTPGDQPSALNGYSIPWAARQSGLPVFRRSVRCQGKSRPEPGHHALVRGTRQARAVDSPVPAPERATMEDDRLTPAEYEDWVSPRQTIQRMQPIAEHIVIDALVSGLSSGSIRAVAYQIFLIGKSAKPRLETVLSLLPPGDWIDDAEERFWSFGSITIKNRLSVWGVRFDPLSITLLNAQMGGPKISLSASDLRTPAQPEEMRPEPTPPPPYRAKRRPKKEAPVPKATHDELRTWLKGWSPQNSDATFPDIERAAGEALNRRITRQPLRDVIGELGLTKNRGKPKRW